MIKKADAWWYGYLIIPGRDEQDISKLLATIELHVLLWVNSLPYIKYWAARILSDIIIWRPPKNFYTAIIVQ